MISEICRAVLDFAKHALAAEGMTTAGRVNVVGMVLAFVLLAGIGALDLIQAAVRVIRPHYHHGVPFERLFLIYAGYLLLCAVIGGIMTPRV